MVTMVSPLYPNDEELESPQECQNTPPILAFPKIFSSSPQLEIKDFGDLPFSHSFSGLFDLVCHSGDEVSALKPAVEPQALPRGEEVQEFTSNPDASYNIQHFSNIKDLDPEWEHDEIEEIVVMKRKPRLPRISEESARDVNLQPISFSSFEMLRPLRETEANSSKDITFVLGRHRDTSKLYAVKSIPLASQTSYHDAHLEQHILETLRSLSSPFLPYLFCTFEHLDRFYLVTDYHPGNDLLARINASGRLSIERSRIYGTELASAICVLHDAGIIHGDLRPENIFFNKDGHIVIALPNEYQAPEVILGWSHDFSVDCWGFGILLHMMITGTHPLLKDGNCRDPAVIRDTVLCEVPHYRHRDLITDSLSNDLVAKCLERNSALRPTIHEIQLHRYLSSARSACSSTIKSLRHSSLNSNICLDDDLSLSAPIKQDHYRRIRRRSSFHVHGLGVDWDPSSFSRSRFSDDGLFGDLTIPANMHSDFPAPPNSIVNVARPLSDAFSQRDEVMQDPSVVAAKPPELITPGNDAANADLDKRAEEQAARDQFWETISLRQGSNSSSRTLDALGLKTRSNLPARKLRKWRSCLVSPRFLSSHSSSHSRSATNKLRKKILRRPESTPAFLPAQPHVPVALPSGLEHIGSGIGFTYCDPTAARSKASICSASPRMCPTSILPAGLVAIWTGLRKTRQGFNTKRGNPRIQMDRQSGAGVTTHTTPSSRPRSWDLEVTVPSPLAAPPLISSLYSPVSDDETIQISTPDTVIGIEAAQANCVLNSASASTLRLVARDGIQQIEEAGLVSCDVPDLDPLV